MDGGTARLTVGELARAAGMTAKALRHYDQLGLFRPDGVDEGNGYRWYDADRVPQARLIARLRGVGSRSRPSPSASAPVGTPTSSIGSSSSTAAGWRVG